MKKSDPKSVFKTCPNCSFVWKDRDSFLSDPHLHLVGYQADFGELNAGLFLFQHDVPDCLTSLAIEAEAFTDLHEGPIFKKRLTGTHTCPGHCLRVSSLEPCPNHCECAFVRDVLQKVKEWPKHKAA